MVAPASDIGLRYGGLLPRGTIMQDVTLVGIDLGKHSFHLHGQDRKGKEVFRRKVTCKQLVELPANFPACTIVMEACAGAHIECVWAPGQADLTALRTALRQGQQKRFRGCGGDLRGGSAPVHALRDAANRTTASAIGTASRSGIVG